MWRSGKESLMVCFSESQVQVTGLLKLAHFAFQNIMVRINTPGRWQSKTLSTINDRGSKIDRNSVFDCHLSPVCRQMAIEISVSNNF